MNTHFYKYQDVLQYMFDKLPMYQRIGAPAYKKNLDNTLNLLERAGNPHLRLKTIHVAGTNGKGSTSHIIAGGLQSQGYKTGLYTSPHYKDFRERIKINGQYISAGFIKYFVNTYYNDLEEIQPSFFEMTVVLAFLWFEKNKVDYAVVETGLGGRLDSTNVITPLLSVITNISYDHQNMLGDTLPEIAFEKAGIIKPGVPVLIGEKQAEVKHVFTEKSKKEKASMFFAEDIVSVSENFDENFNITADGKTWLTNFSIDIGGPFQIKNLTTAMASLWLLKKYIDIDDHKLLPFFKNFCRSTKFMGRWHIISKNPLILADSAHNEGGIKYVVNYLEKQDKQNLHIVLGFVKDKELSNILELFPKNARYYFVKADIPRGLPAKELAELALEKGLTGKVYTSVKRGFSAARKQLSPNDILFIGGSIFVVAEIL
jgi:dihydrofolate synthase/folylpolyglutamate synthase